MRRRFRLRLEELNPRINPVVTSAVFSSGQLTVTDDGSNDQLFLVALPSGDIQLQDQTATPIAITGSPTLGNTTAIVMQGAGGNDRLDVSQLVGGSFTILLDGGAGDDTLVGGLGVNSLVGGIGNDSIQGGQGDDILDGGAGNDSLQGGQGDDKLIGGTGDDHLDGGAGDDILEGDAGADSMTGGTGDDQFDGTTNADASPDTLIETIPGDAQITDVALVGIGTDSLLGIEQVVITTGAGNHKLDAGSRSTGVSLIGGSGNDTLIGTPGADSLDGQDGNDSLVGNGGDDSLTGGLGNDTMRGGAGNDSLTGGLGNDRIYGDTGTDRLIEDPSTAGAVGTNLTLTNTSLGGALGLDLIFAIEQASLSAVQGNGANLFNAYAFSGPVTLNGAGGNDSLIGGAASDVLTGGAGVNKLNGGATGSDTVVESANLSYVLANTQLLGNGPNGITDNLIGVEHANLTGGQGANTLDASAFTLGRVTLNGGGGNDELFGTPYGDFLTGAAGNDSIDGGNGLDTLIDSIDATSLVLTNTALTASQSLGTDLLVNIEKVELDGGTSANTIDASAFTAGVVTLNGGAGDDSLIGGALNDVLIGGAGNDTFAGGGGIDLLTETADTNFTLTNTTLDGGAATGTDTIGANIERIQLTGGAGNNVFTVSGSNAFAVTLTGGTGTDTVASTDDTDFTLTNTKLTRTTGGTFTLSSIETAALTGGANANNFDVGQWTGSATLTGGGGSDKVLATGNGNFRLTDTLLTHSTGGSFSLSGITLARLSGGIGNNRIDATGFNGQVTLLGGDGNDTLIGGNGSDSLFGGNGNDFLDGSNGTDTLNGGNGFDTGANGEVLISMN
ncbi:MAG TPA: calcium-binding protein [Gemmataceae bacterium]|jgi:Ca2+-binding RTX toxin-like protein|nr:calcium-binding protein [Gemmataceae bacterium]